MYTWHYRYRNATLFEMSFYGFMSVFTIASIDHIILVRLLVGVVVLNTE